MLTTVLWSVRVRVAMVAAAAALLILGFTTLPRLSVETLPEFSPTTVEVQTEALGLSAEEVEQLITVPLEQNLLNGVAFLETIESASLPGLSSVVMTFEAGTDLLTARQVVAERLTQAGGMAGLVQVAKPPQMLQPRSSASRVAMIRLSSPDQSLIEQSVLARWVIVPRLLGVEGVANVAIWGFRDRQLQVIVDPVVLGEHGVSLSQVVRTAGNALEVSPLSFLEASSPGTGGWIETVNQRLHIFHEQTISTPEELERVPLAPPEGAAPPAEGSVLTLGDVSEVVEDHQPLVGDAYCTPSGDDCLLLVVEAFPDANTLEVANGLEAVLETLRPGLGNIEIDTSIYRPADHIRSVFASLGWALSIGAVLLLSVLIAYLWHWRPVLVALASVLLSLVAAGLVLYLLEVTINIIIVAGLVLGLMVIVGDTVIRVDRVITRLRWSRRGDGASPRRSLVEALVELAGPLFYATLIGAAGLVPLLFSTGPNRVFVSPIAAAYLLALGASLVMALTVTPALGVLLLDNDLPPATAPMAGVLQRGYDRLGERLVNGWRPALTVGAALLGLGLVTLPFLQASLRPSLREGDVLVHLAADPGTSLARMDEILAGSVEEIAAVPGVESVGAHVGRAVASDQVVDVYSGEIWVGLEQSADYDATLSAIATNVGDLPGVSSEVLTYLQERIRDVMPESSQDQVTVRVYGEDPAVLNATAEDVRQALLGIDGVSDASLILPIEQPTIEVEVDLEAAQRLGVSPGDVRREAAILLSGLTVGNLFEEQKVFDVVVWGRPGIRQSEEDVRRLLIETPGAGHVPLGDLAEVRVVSSPAVIRHHAVMTYRDVVAQVPEGDGDGVAFAVAAALDRVDFPLEYHAELLGGTTPGASRLGTWAAVAAAALAVFLLLQAAFGSWRLALLAFGSLTAALAGGVASILVADSTITLGSLAGLVGVLAISARVFVLLIRSYQQRQLRDGVAFGPDLVLASTREWVGPVLASAGATLAVLAPMLVMGSGAGFELLHPMAVVVTGGVVTSALVGLGVLPSLYLRFGDVPHPDTTAEDLSAQPVEAGTLAGEPGR